MVLAVTDGRPLVLRDLADLELGYDEELERVVIDGVVAVELIASRTPDAEVATVAAAVRGYVAQQAALVPPHIRVAVVDEAPPAPTSTIRLEIRGEDLETLDATACQAVRLLERTPGTAVVAYESPPAVPDLVVRPDRERLALLGLSTADVTSAVAAATDGIEVGQTMVDGQRVPLVLHWGRPSRDPIEALRHVTLRTPDGAAEVPLIEVTTIELTTAPAFFQRVDGQRAVSIDVELADDRRATRDGVTDALGGLDLPAGTALVFVDPR